MSTFRANAHPRALALAGEQCPHPTAHAGHAENGVVQCPSCKGPRSIVEMYGKRRTIARCPCTPPVTVETFCEKFSARPGSGKEIAGLEEKNKNTMT